MRRLEGLTALITGGSRGFGRATALRFADEGADVAICYRGAANAAADVVDQIESKGQRAFSYQADVARPEDARTLVARAIADLGSLDVMVNNAGIRHIAPFAEQDPEEWGDMLSTNIWGTMIPMQAALKSMIERGEGGKVINLSSQMAHVGWENFAVYAATKAYILTLTRSVAKEVGQYGITVNSVCPGPIITDMNRANTPPEREAQISAAVPLRRMGDPEDVAAAVAYLASDDGKFVTGQCVDVNGGLVTA